jgi:hypothetical protein
VDTIQKTDPPKFTMADWRRKLREEADRLERLAQMFEGVGVATAEPFREAGEVLVAASER